MQTPPVGQRFGRYVVESQIGVGGMGVVYAAVDTHLQRRVALKVVSTQHASSAEFRERFQREAATLARLDSPHIIAIFDHGEEAGQPYLATQLVRGGDLGELLTRRGRLAPRAALTVCSQLADALTDAHAAGVVHRDIKPSNVLVRDPDAPRLHVYLCDFGIAIEESAERLTTAGGVVGTWAYLAPERSQGDRATPASDLYALGCLLWVCLTGEAPYVGTDVRVAMSHVTAPVRQLAGSDPMSRHLNEVLARSMAKDPGRRYASAAQLRGALDAAPPVTAPLVPVPLPGAERPVPPTQMTPHPRTPSQPPTMAPPPHRAPPPYRPYAPSPTAEPDRPRRGPWVTVVAAVVALLAVVGGATWLTRGDGADRVQDSPSASGSPETADSPDGPASSVTSDPPGPAPDDSVRGDLDGDRDGDTLAVFQDGTDGTPVRYTFSSDGSTFTTETEDLATFDFPVYVDADGDGASEDYYAVFDGDGSMVLESSVPAVDNARYGGIDVLPDIGFVDTYAGDFTGDGAPDLLVTGQTGPRTVSIWVLANEGGVFADPVEWAELRQSHTFTTTVTTGDFDDDARTDVLLGVPIGTPTFDGTNTTYDGPRGSQVLASTGSSFDTTGPPVESDALADNPFFVVGDFSGDGTPLVAVAGPSTGPPRLLVFGVESGVLVPRPELTVEVADPSGYAASVRAAASDVDGDGLDDLVLTKKTSEKRFLELQVARSQGTSFATPVAWAETPRCREDLCFLVFLPSY